MLTTFMVDPEMGIKAIPKDFFHNPISLKFEVQGPPNFLSFHIFSSSEVDEIYNFLKKKINK